jgi:hypothetical protein
MKTVAPYPNAPTHTKITGYYNPLDMPFQLHVPELNRNILLGPREFVQLSRDEEDPNDPKKTVRKRTKVNDPIFESYVGPNKLAREVGDEEVEIIWLTRPKVEPIPTHLFEFAGKQKFQIDPNSGRVLNPERVVLEQQSGLTKVPASASSITGYSMDQAIKMGVIKPAAGKMPEKNEVQVDNRPPAHTQHAPVPQAPKPRQPGETRPVPPPFKPPVDDTLRAPKSLPAAKPVNVAATTPVHGNPPPPLALPAIGSEIGNPNEVAEDLLADNQQLDGAIQVEAADLGQIAKNTAAAAGLKPIEVPQSPPPVVETVPPSAAPVVLPEPNLPPESAATPPPAPQPPAPRSARRRLSTPPLQQ